MLHASLQSSTVWLGPLSYLVTAAVSFLLLYWVVRLAVRHGILDAKKREDRRSEGPNSNGDRLY